MKIKELLSDPHNWIQGDFALDNYSHPVPSNSEDAACWCLYGAAVRCYYDGTSITFDEDGNIIMDNKLSEVLCKIEKYISKIDNGDSSIVDFNDEHSYEDIIKLCEELDI